MYACTICICKYVNRQALYVVDSSYIEMVNHKMYPVSI